VEVLRNLTFTVPEGQFCAIMGPSGSGKSTVLHVAAGLTPLTTGEIAIGTHRLSELSDHEAALFRRREIGFIFQFFHLLPYLTAEETSRCCSSTAGAAVIAKAPSACFEPQSDGAATPARRSSRRTDAAGRRRPGSGTNPRGSSPTS
jgi:predicted ABC-type transport system involved in lysophospholipase L1 biosynthesis ATPase subunit